MKNLKETLQKLEDADMHVHVIDHDQHDYSYPLAYLVGNSHLVMHFDEIVHVGSPDTIERFALAL